MLLVSLVVLLGTFGVTSSQATITTIPSGIAAGSPAIVELGATSAERATSAETASGESSESSQGSSEQTSSTEIMSPTSAPPATAPTSVAVAPTAVATAPTAATAPSSPPTATQPVVPLRTALTGCQENEHVCPCSSGTYCLFRAAACLNPAAACPVEVLGTPAVGSPGDIQVTAPVTSFAPLAPVTPFGPAIRNQFPVVGPQFNNGAFFPQTAGTAFGTPFANQGFVSSPFGSAVGVVAQPQVIQPAIQGQVYQPASGQIFQPASSQVYQPASSPVYQQPAQPFFGQPQVFQPNSQAFFSSGVVSQPQVIQPAYYPATPTNQPVG